jgi:hypothetical protein
MMMIAFAVIVIIQVLRNKSLQLTPKVPCESADLALEINQG